MHRRNPRLPLRARNAAVAALLARDSFLVNVLGRLRGQFVSPPALGAVVALAIGVGFGVAAAPVVPLAFFIAVGVATVCIQFGRPLLTVMCLFFVFQDPLQVFAGSTTPAALVVKRADEALVLLLGAVALFDKTTRAALRQAKLPLLVTSLLRSPVGVLGPWRSQPAGDRRRPRPFFQAFSSRRGRRFHPDFRSPGPAPVGSSFWGCAGVTGFSFVFLSNPEMQATYLAAFRPFEERLGFIAAQGFFINPATFAWFAIATFAIAFASYLAWHRRSHLVIMGLAGAAVVLSWRRKSLLAMAAVLLASVLIRANASARTRAVGVVLLTIMIVISVLLPFLSALTERTFVEYGNPDPMGTARSALYYTSGRIAIDYFPLGTGPGHSAVLLHACSTATCTLTMGFPVSTASPSAILFS